MSEVYCEHGTFIISCAPCLNGAIEILRETQESLIGQRDEALAQVAALVTIADGLHGDLQMECPTGAYDADEAKAKMREGLPAAARALLEERDAYHDGYNRLTAELQAEREALAKVEAERDSERQLRSSVQAAVCRIAAEVEDYGEHPLQGRRFSAVANDLRDLAVKRPVTPKP